MKILMTGATGLVGTALGQALVREGHEVHALVRSEKAILNFPAKRFLDAREAVVEADVLINLAGANIAEKRWSEKRKEELRSSRIDTALNLAKAAKDQNKIFQLAITASATGFYGDRGDERLTEESRPGSDFLARLCVEWEAAALEIPAERRASPRFGVVLSREGGFIKKVAPLFTMTGASALGSGRQWFSWIHIDDLVAGILRILNDPLLYGPINFVAPESATNAELTEDMAKELHVYPAPAVPELALKALYGEMTQALVGSQRSVPERLQTSGFHWKYPDLKSALAEILGGLKTGEIRFVYTHWLPKSAAELWPFFSSETNLEKLTPPFLNFKVIGKTTPEIEKGTEIRYKLSLYGVKFGWLTRIEDWQENRYFVDNQMKGPYEKWHHLHEFEELAGGTLMRDTITFKPPMGWLGRLVALPQVMKTVDKIFAYRTETIDRIFSTR